MLYEVITRVLSMISKLIRPKNILEIGTYTGYSAICLAEGMQADGELHTIDHNEELFDFQRKYFDKSGYGKHVITSYSIHYTKLYDIAFR